MKAIPIETARKAAKDAGAYRLAIIAVADDGTFAVTTYGRTRDDCQRLGKWADMFGGEVAADMNDA